MPHRVHAANAIVVSLARRSRRVNERRGAGRSCADHGEVILAGRIGRSPNLEVGFHVGRGRGAAGPSQLNASKRYDAGRRQVGRGRRHGGRRAQQAINLETPVFAREYLPVRDDGNGHLDAGNGGPRVKQAAHVARIVRFKRLGCAVVVVLPEDAVNRAVGRNRAGRAGEWVAVRRTGDGARGNLTWADCELLQYRSARRAV